MQMGLLILDTTRPLRIKAASHHHISRSLRQKRVPNILLIALHPRIPALLTKRPKHEVLAALHELRGIRRRGGSDGIDVVGEFYAVFFEGEIVDVVAEGVFDFAADGGDAEDYVGRDDGARDCDPAQRVPELEGEQHYVEPGCLADGDGIGDW